MTTGSTSLSPAKQALLAKLLAGKGHALARPQGPAASGAVPAEVPLTPAQERIWLADQLTEDAPLFTLGFTARAERRMDLSDAQLLLEGLLSRHAALRSRVVVTDDGPVIRFRPTSDFRVEHIELGPEADPSTARRLAELEREWLAHRFDLTGEPLIRVGLVTFPDAVARLLVAVHHLTVDAASLQVMLHEVMHGAPPGPGLDYPDIAVWEASEPRVARRKRLVGEAVAALAGAPDPVSLPNDLVPPAVPDFSAGIHDIAIPVEVADRIRKTARRLGLTDQMVMLAVWAVLVARWSGQSDLVLGMPVSGRDAEGALGVVGPFINTVVLRVTVDPEAPVMALFEQVRTRVTEALRRQDAPFNEVMAAVYGRSARIGVIFNKYAVDPAFSALEAGLPRTAAENGVALEISDDGRVMRPRLIFQKELYTEASMTALGQRFAEVLRAACVRPEQPVGALGMPAALAREGSAAQREPATMADLLGRHAERTAVQSDSETLSYGELRDCVRSLRDRLLAAGVRPGQTVAVSTTRSVNALVALLAVLDAAAVYVPIPVGTPQGRREQILASARPRVRVTETMHAGKPAELTITTEDGEDGEKTAPQPVPAAESCDLVGGYCLYTSGSTGRPKGVLVRRAALLAHAASAAAAYGITANDRCLQFSGHGFDVWIEQAVVALTSGATVVLRGDDLWDPADFAAEAAARRITVANLPTPYWHELCAQGGTDLKQLADGPLREVLVGGEALDRGALDTWFGHVSGTPRLNNVYGPTEAVITAVHGGLGPEDARWASVPLGNAMPGRHAYVLDPAGNSVDAGAVGELYLGGLVADGYVDDPRATALRFLPDPYTGGGRRMYRTGDMVRLRHDGRLEFRGRRDGQVKLSGIRTELGEVESVLRRHPQVNEAVVLLCPQPEPHLVAWARCETGAAVDEAGLRALAAAHLPPAAVPRRIRVTSELPLTSGGKVDRAALRDEAEQEALTPPPVSADTADDVTRELLRIWGELLGRADIRTGDDFFALGGSSLLATRVAAACTERFGRRVSLATVFNNPVLDHLAAHIRRTLADEPEAETGGTAADDLPEPRHPEDDAPVPLSAAQRRFLFLSRYAAEPQAYNVPIALRIDGPLDVDALAGAVCDVLSAHESLRLAVRMAAHGPEGRILPVTRQKVRADLEPQRFVSSVECGEQAAELAALPLDLAEGPLRMALLSDGGGSHLLLLCVHHIACDGESVETIVHQLVRRYAAHATARDAEPMPAAVQYSDVAGRQEARLAYTAASMLRRRAAALEDVRPLEVLSPRDGFDHKGAVTEVVFKSDALTRAAARAAVTPNAVMVALWQLAVHRWTGQDDFAVGLPVSLRTHEAQHEVVGPLLNSIAVLAHFPSTGSLSDHVKCTQRRLAEAYEDRFLPFEQLVREVVPERDTSSVPLFQTLVAWEGSRGDLSTGQTVFRPEELVSGITQFPLALEMYEDGERLRALVRYSTTLVGDDDARLLAESVGAMLRVLDEDPERPLYDLDTDEDEAPAYMPEPPAEDFRSLPMLTAALPGDRPAVSDAHRELTHARLELEVADAAARLGAMGVGRGDCVCTFLPRTVETVVAMLAIMRCGAVYVPVDRRSPRERVHDVAEQCGASVIVVHAEDASAVEELPQGIRVLALGALENPGPQSAPAQVFPVVPDDPAYLIFTSGSTGVPKAVVVGHGELAAFREAIAPQWGPDETLIAVTTVGFDVSVLELLVALSLGAHVVLHDSGLVFDPAALAAHIAQVRATRLYSVPSLWEQVLATDADLTGMTGGCGGEPLSPALAERARRRGVHLHNLYGPTETVIWATDQLVDDLESPSGHALSEQKGAKQEPQGQEGAGRRVPVGCAVPGVIPHVLDQWLRPARTGAEGQLYIAGRTVAQGYYRAPAATALRFVPDPFGPAGSRMYRTGDRMRQLPDGALEFLGRIDDQVKVRGFRVEPGEIEAVLSGHPQVREAAVVIRDGRLIAYVVPGEGKPAQEEVRAHVAARLPAHMVPAICFLGALPLTPSGKVDRKAMPEPQLSASGESEPPRDAVERVLAEIWSGTLSVAAPGREDNFFDQGGDSISALRIVDRIRRVLRTELSVTDVFEAQTIAQQSAKIRAANPNAERMATVAEHLLMSAKASQ
ncbi:non-ribosomal peptide synthetase [Streptomyces marianii]|uniref:Amino acid adenylation domain-containing protein n=1 Tax=Streptomyces marianii TaxID=1817406 RepID=A0A5R9E3L9_9ACTN|nr:non-ribosomal peptide synthetase [Streptomyces marianii]TLQ44538.1 amino acid adenylation domain-containing protein [Streptomyces marianii]